MGLWCGISKTGEAGPNNTGQHAEGGGAGARAAVLPLPHGGATG